ncbi:MAG: LptF/LptG family permease [Hyphomicrobiales bacterium]|nr:LptF/LptG family permease [Hyphomicrobiales bacterium]
MSLGALIGVVWATQALRQMNLVTAKGAALLVFFKITALALPFLTIVVAPFAVLIAAIQTLNALNADSELVVLNASGASRGIVLRPLLVLAGLVAASMMFLSVWGSPTALRELRQNLAQINIDLVANLVQPGKFVSIEKNLTFHIRSRAPDGSLGGLFVEDARDPAIAFTYIADQASIVEMFGKTLLVMRDGVIERRTQPDGNLSLIDFQSYAFDLSAMTPAATAPVYRPSERSTEELMTAGGPHPDDYARNNAGRLRSELHDRLTQPLLPISFTLFAFLALGDARTTREGRGLSIIGAIAAVGALRGAHFTLTSASGASDVALGLLWALSLGVIAWGAFVVATDRRVALPAAVARALDAANERVGAIGRRLADRLGLAGEREEDAT